MDGTTPWVLYSLQNRICVRITPCCPFIGHHISRDLIALISARCPSSLSGWLLRSLIRYRPRLRTPPTKHTPLPPSRPIPPPTLPTILAAFTLIPRDILPIGLTSTLESLNTVPTGFYEKCYIGQGEDRRLGWVSPKEGERGGMNTDWYCSIPPSPPSDNPEPNVKLKVESESNVLEVEGQQYAPAYVYQSDFVTLGPILSVAFRTRLQTHPNPNQTTLISFDPGDKGWLDHFEDHSRHAASDLLRPSTDPAIPRGIRWYPKTRSSSAQIEKTDPIILFAPNAFHYTPKHLLITLTLNITPSFLPLVLNTLAKEGKKYGCDQIRAWGVDPTEPLGQRWKELGATVEDRFLTRENPWGVAWYGGDPGRGEYVRAEMWAFH